MDKKKKLDRILLVVAIIVILLALVNLGINFYKFGGLDKLTGNAAADVGTANLTIQSFLTINFTTEIINWGNGAVTDGAGQATLDSFAGTVVGGNWTVNSAGLVLRNDGNVNARINLTASNNASTFIGGSSPTYEIKTTSSETGSCVAGLASTYATANETSMPSCGNLTYINANDTLKIDVKVVIPDDAVQGVKGSTITATATAIA